jgi:imidazolonepropionase-like amidohydrolase/Tol biopolymer transport system component
MLGDIYIMPVTGGQATLLRGGYPFEVQPRFSPDGKKISFTSDAGGGDNIWIMNIDGSDPEQITKEDFRLLNNAVWSPDGQYLVARKHFTSERSLGAGELWMYHISGGSGIQLVKKMNDQQDLGEPYFSPDGRYIYYSQDVYPGGFFKYNKDPNSQIYVIKRYDIQKGKSETVIQGPGGAVRPQVSPDGEKLAFVRRVREKSVLYIHDLETGIQKPVFDKLSKDQQEAWAIFGVYTNYNWLPNNENIIIWAGGKILKINTLTGNSEDIEFTASADHKISEALYFKHEVSPEKFKVNVIRHAVTSPDERFLVFNAVGYLWAKELPDGKPERLTSGTDFEFEPSFSPDGKHIVYVTWNDEEKGNIKIMEFENREIKTLTTNKGIYRTPSFSPDGKKIVYQKESGNLALGMSYTKEPGLYWISSEGGGQHFITSEGAFPRFDHSGQRIFYQTGGYLFGSLKKSFKSVNLQGGEEIIHFKSTYANQYNVSPDNKWLAFGELHQVYIIPFNPSGQTFELSASTKALPVAKVSDDAGINLHWTKDSKMLHWTLGEIYYAVDVKNCFTFLEGSPDTIAEIKKDIIHVGLELTTDVPEGIIAFEGAKVLTMEGETVIDEGVVVVENNRIISVGEKGEVQIPRKAKIVDVSGKVIMPGIIDSHAHLFAFRYGLSPQKEWTYYANLAYGITATHDPSSNSEMSFSQSEMVKAGIMVGPRIYTTGTIIYGADGDFKAVINNLDDARSALKRTQAYGAFSIKSYNQPRRDQRQQIIKAARELGIMVYPEGGSTFYHNLSEIYDGHTSIEHNLPIAPLYEDVLQLWSASKTANTPTLIVNYGGLNGEYYWYQKTNVWENEKLLKYTPRSIIDSQSRHRTMVPDEEYDNGHILVSESCKALSDRGVRICVGGHGQLQGLGVHWEMWNLAQGGMNNMQVLKAATIDGADYIGMGDDMGSIKVGKLADLIVLEKDPLEDILNTNSIDMVMINGRLYDTDSMNEIGNVDKKRSRFFWELDAYNDNFKWHEEIRGFTLPGCTCGSH